MHRRDLLAWLIGAPLAAPLRQQPSSRTAGDLVALDAVDIAARARARELSVVELTEAYLARIEALNPSIGAFVTVTRDRARADARRIGSRRGSTPGPLAGVPVAHKDLFETAGIRTTAGSRLYEHHIPLRDADIVRALAAAGTVLLGKTNTHELGGGVTTINPFYGTTRNPWDRSRIPGGSSGGSAAAVAAGLVVAATGSDTGGSVRIPAALCGCVGFKPSFGRLSTRGLLGASPTFDHTGLLTRSVADAELISRTLTPEIPRRGAREQLQGGGLPQGRRLRIGVPANYFFDAVPDDVTRAIVDAVSVLRSFADEVRDVATPIDADTMSRVFDPIVVAEIQTRFAADWKSRPDAFSPAFARLFQAARPSAQALDAARQALAAFRRDVEALFNPSTFSSHPRFPARRRRSTARSTANCSCGTPVPSMRPVRRPSRCLADSTAPGCPPASSWCPPSGRMSSCSRSHGGFRRKRPGTGADRPSSDAVPRHRVRSPTKLAQGCANWS